jgi:hypothetical protein
MPLRSLMLSSNQRLQACLVDDKAHVTQGDSGDHVALIQTALIILDGADIVADGRFGPLTAAAVLSYKTKRGIINRSYQQRPDAIVGKMTIQSLDDEMLVLEAPFAFLPGATALIRGLFFAPTIKSKPPKLVIVTETNPPWFAWAKQVKKHFDSLPDTKGLVVVVPLGNGLSVAAAASALASAGAAAGELGILVLSVGHGAPGTSPDSGVFDLAPNHKFQLGGRNAWMVGQPKPKDLGQTDPRAHPHPSQTNAFYADRPQSSPGITVLSDLENDQNSQSHNAKVRLDNFRQYQKIMTAFKPLGLIVLLTCRVGGASGFLQRVRQQFGTPLLAYKRRVAGQSLANGRTRLFLEGDAPGAGTNVPTGEFLIPIAPNDMSLIF